MIKFILPKIAASILLIFFTFLPFLALAEQEIGSVSPTFLKLNVPIGGLTSIGPERGFPYYIAAWYGFIIGTVGILATVMIMWAGFKWLTSRGNSSTISDAKDIIWSSIIGLLIAFLSYAILHLINPNLTNIEMPSLAGIKTSVTTSAPGGIPAPGVPDTTPTPPGPTTPGAGTTNLTLAGEKNSAFLTVKGVTSDIEPRNQLVIDPDTQLSYVGGKSSVFGGPNDYTVGSTERGYISNDLLRDLNPNNDYYIAFRFNYKETPLSQLRSSHAIVYYPDGNNGEGAFVKARIVDWGPNPETTDKDVDTSNAVLRDLGAKDGDNIYIRLVPATGELGPTLQ